MIPQFAPAKLKMNAEFLKIAAAIALPQVGGLLTALLALPELMGWYQRLNFPPIAPPNWVFPPVWTVLNTALGYASYLVWSAGGGFVGTGRLPLALYGTQLVLNWAWTPVFFKLHRLRWVGVWGFGWNSRTNLGFLSSELPDIPCSYSGSVRNRICVFQREQDGRLPDLPVLCVVHVCYVAEL